MSHSPQVDKTVDLNPVSVTLNEIFSQPSVYPATGYFTEHISLAERPDHRESAAHEEDPRTAAQLHSVLLVAGPYRAVISSWGARLLSFVGPDGVDIVVGPRQKDALLMDDGAMGAVVGRVANRIGLGQLAIPGQGTYQLPLNDGPHHLHGGPQGFHQRLWQVERVSEGRLGDKIVATMSLSLTSTSGDQGYPGHVHVIATYQLSSDGALTVDLITHVTEAITPVNLTHHAYWNLSGQLNHTETCLNTFLFTKHSAFLETDRRHLPTGRILSVKDSPFDFTREKTLGADLPQPSETSPVGGYDVYLTGPVLADNQRPHAVSQHSAPPSSEVLPIIARLEDGKRQRSLEIRSNQPGFQLYTGNYLRGSYRQYQAVCIEPSGLVDAVNHANFPTILVQPGQTVRQTTVFHLRCVDRRVHKQP